MLKPTSALPELISKPVSITFCKALPLVSLPSSFLHCSPSLASNLLFPPQLLLPQHVLLPRPLQRVDARGHPLTCISTSLLTFSCFYFSRWYHGHLSGAAAESLLQVKATPWTFLVRESLSKPGDFVLSVLTDQPKPGSDVPSAGASSASGARLKVTHVKIMCEVSGWECHRVVPVTLHLSLPFLLSITSSACRDAVGCNMSFLPLEWALHRWRC